MRNYLLVGACGSGKTWVMRQIIMKKSLNVLGKVGTILFHRNDKLIVLGKYDGTIFEGSDKLSMAVMLNAPALKEYANMTGRIIIAEGDRFTNQNYIKLMKPYIIKIKDDGTNGRLKRGSSQTDRQIQSIATRVGNIKANIEVSNSDDALKLLLKELR